MRRNAACLVLCTLIAALTGCKTKDKGPDAGLGPYDAYAMSAPETIYEPIGDYPTYGAATAPATDETWSTSTLAATMPDTTAAAAAARYHTVVKRDTLYSISRQYYADQSRWKDIFTANRTQISDPNRIRVGQRLLIP